jgi:hypothetical protein
MNRDTVVDVVRVVKKTKRTQPPSGNLSQDFKSSSGCMCAMNLAVVYIGFLIAGADRKNVCNGPSRIDNE